MSGTLPTSAQLHAAYPNYRDSRFVKQLIGGAVDDTGQGPDKEWIGNTCTIRISRALNGAGAAIPRSFHGLTTIRGGDGLRYAFRVREFFPFMEGTYGAPQVDQRTAPITRTPFAGKSGILGFVIRFGDADGHFDLWDGHTFFDEAYGISYPGHDFFEMASRVALWETEGQMPAIVAP